MPRDLFELSTTTYVQGIKPPDDRWLAMKAVWDACTAADVSVPEDVAEFFEHMNPDETLGVVVDLELIGAARLWRPADRDAMREGVDVRLEMVPKDVAIIRFINSY